MQGRRRLVKQLQIISVPSSKKENQIDENGGGREQER